MIGARTARYGDFTDLAAAMTGRVPYAGLHVDANRRGEVLFALPDDAATRWSEDALAVATGSIVGERAGTAVAVITGLPATMSEDSLKALGATAASTGSTSLFHAVGITPEAPDLVAACGGQRRHGREDRRGPPMISPVPLPVSPPCRTVRRSVPIALGTPHFSLTEFARLMPLLDGFVPASGVDLYVNLARDTYAELDRARLAPAVGGRRLHARRRHLHLRHRRHARA